MYKEFNKFSTTKLIAFISIAVLTNQTFAANNIYDSIYNVSHGALIYSYNNGANQYLWADYAHNLAGKWEPNANWKIIYNQDGTVSFANKKSGLCIEHYGTGYQIVENKCTKNHAKQRFNFELVDTGATLIKFSHNEECIYMHSGNFYYSIYSDVCDKKKENFHWAIVPPLASDVIITKDEL
ncbi:hypothetical protein WFL13_04485 [Yersinia enterocolitica]